MVNERDEIKKKRVFSGIQPTGDIHIGNLLGAIKHWVAIQSEFDCIYCVVDLHAITIPQEPKVLRAKIREVAGLLIAAGLDPDQTVIFVQSHITAHAELTWILNCFTPMGWLQRMTQFKEKSERQKEKVSVGLFDYPVLMASDILLYDTDLVPVGEDQRQHLEFTRDLAQRFNTMYGETFVIPDASIPEVGARIMGLENPTKKMSKSEGGEGNTINILDPPGVIMAKIKRATTDSLREIRFDETRPGIYNLLVIYELFTGEERNVIEARFEGKGYADLKKELGEVVVEGLRPIQERYKELTRDPKHIDSLLLKAADRVRPIAEDVLSRVKDKMGIG
ncbi:MAG: tryptophan--tRNA ligase [Deltaproteobacteria bacterium]|nr:tryptophan--tRNA ligase [Deltaproteobacteria bacterium]